MTRPKDPESTEKEARLQRAVVEYKKRQKKSRKGHKVSLRRVAKDFNVCRQTLKNRLDGKLPRNNKERRSTLILNVHDSVAILWIPTGSSVEG